MDNPIPTDPEAKQKDIVANKDMAALSYVWILSVIIFFARKDSPFIRFHSRQAIILFLVSIPLWLIPIVGHFIALIVLGGNLIGFINAANGLYTDVPFVGPLSRGEKSLVEVCKEGWTSMRKIWKAMIDSFTKQQSQETRPENPVQLNEQPNPNPNPPSEPPSPQS